MAEEKIPEYLYYYTDIDTLALILKNHTIRLNSLDKMDDKQEQMSKDKQNFGKFVFISSWTEDEVEQIPMWRMYTPKGRGVRIKLKSNPFKTYEIDCKEYGRLLGIDNVQGDDAINFKLIVPLEDYINDVYSISNYCENNQLLKIIYTDDNNLLYPSLFKSDEQGTHIDYGELGVYKNTYWNFQKEWRYRLMILPMSFKKMMWDGIKGNFAEMTNFVLNSAQGTASLPFNYYDLYIRDECFEDMSIMLAPDITEPSRIIAKLLVEKYNPSCNISESSLKDLIQ